MVEFVSLGQSDHRCGDPHGERGEGTEPLVGGSGPVGVEAARDSLQRKSPGDSGLLVTSRARSPSLPHPCPTGTTATVIPAPGVALRHRDGPHCLSSLLL